MSRLPLTGVHHTGIGIIGGGLAGCAAALELVRRGRKVVLVEAQKVGAGAAGEDLGHLPVGLDCRYPEAVERLGHENARLVWEIRRENVIRTRELLGELGLSSTFDPRGGFAVACDREEARALADGEDLLRDDGFAGEFLDHYMMEARFAVRGLTGGYWAADDGAIDVVPLVHALAAAAEAAGAEVFEASHVRGLDTTGADVELTLDRGLVHAEVVIVTGGACALVSELSSKVARVPARRVDLSLGTSPDLPSPASLDRGRIAWRVRDARLVVFGRGAESDDPAGFAQEHVAEIHGGVAGSRTVDVTMSRDLLPFLGPIDAGRVVTLSASAGYTLLAARWAAEYLVSGVDPAPLPVRAARPFGGLG